MSKKCGCKTKRVGEWIKVTYCEAHNPYKNVATPTKGAN